MTRIFTSTADVTNGNDVIVWHGVFLNATNCPADSVVTIGHTTYYVLALVDTTHIQLTTPYAGTTASGVTAEISAWTQAEVQTATIAARLATLLNEISTLDANGRGMFFNYQGIGSDVDPGFGNLTFDNVDPNAASAFYVSETDANENVGFDVSGLLSMIGAGSVVLIRSIASAAYVAFLTTSNLVDQGIYRKATGMTYVGGDGVLSIGEPIGLSWTGPGSGQAFVSMGGWSNVVTYAANNLVSYGGFLYASNVNGNLNHQPVASPLPISNAYWTYIQLPSTGDFIDIALFAQGSYGSGDLLFRYEFSGTATFQATLPLSKASAGTNPTGNVSFILKRNGVTFGTIDFHTATSEATFTAASDTTFTAGNILTVFAPASSDATLADVSASLRGIRDSSGSLLQHGAAQLDFGAFPGASDTSVVVAGLASIKADSVVFAQLFPGTGTADHSADEHKVAGMRVTVSDVTAGASFKINGVATDGGRHYGLYNVAWEWA